PRDPRGDHEEPEGLACREVVTAVPSRSRSEAAAARRPGRSSAGGRPEAHQLHHRRPVHRTSGVHAGVRTALRPRVPAPDAADEVPRGSHALALVTGRDDLARFGTDIPADDHRARAAGGATVSEKKLAGKVAIVTGGARGLGRGYALRLAGLGADIAIVD